jgi:hypothetical protein
MNSKPVQWLDPDGNRISETDADTVQPEDWFEDVTGQSGVDVIYRTGREANRLTILETLGGGVCLFDVDGDRDLDLFCPGGGTIDSSSGAASGMNCKLFRNEGHFQFTDITAQSGLSMPIDYSHAAVASDYDRDGDIDLFVACFGKSRLLRNRGGIFTDVTSAAGLLAESWDTSAVFVDLTADGLPDLYVTSYVHFDPRNAQPCGTPPDRQDVCPPQDYSPLADRFYVNQGDGTFLESTHVAGLTNLGRGLGVLAADFNQDHWLDLYVANDGGPNFLYWGRSEFPFIESGLTSGAAVNERGAAEGSMGLDAADLDGDGRPEIVVTNFELEDNSMYHNLGNGQFEHSTMRLGLGGAGRAYVAFGTGLYDFDGDNWPDWYVLNGHVLYRSGQSPFLQPAFLFRNNAGRRFEDVSKRAGVYFRQRHAARGSAVADLDGDGGLDLVVTGLEEPIRLLRHRKPPAKWITLTLQSRGGDLAGVGTDVSIEAFGRFVTIPLRAGSSFASHVDPQATFAVERDRTSVDVTVRWLTGRREIHRMLAVSESHRLTEGTGEPLP